MATELLCTDCETTFQPEAGSSRCPSCGFGRVVDAVRIKATMRFTPAMGYRLVQRDMIVIQEDGSMGIVRAGTKLPLYDEELRIETEPKSTT